VARQGVPRVVAEAPSLQADRGGGKRRRCLGYFGGGESTHTVAWLVSEAAKALVGHFLHWVPSSCLVCVSTQCLPSIHPQGGHEGEKRWRPPLPNTPSFDHPPCHHHDGLGQIPQQPGPSPVLLPPSTHYHGRSRWPAAAAQAKARRGNIPPSSRVPLPPSRPPKQQDHASTHTTWLK